MGEYTKTVAELQAAGFDFGLTSYPIFDELYRIGLNSKILGHYKYNEICDEDSAVFKHYLNQTMAEVMPLYNQMYTSAALSYNPLLSFSRTETTTGNNSVVSTGESTGTQNRTNNVALTATNESATNAANKTNGKEISSDTPQGLLSAGDINGNVWATAARLTENGSTDTGTANSEENTDREETDALTTVNENAANTTGTSSTSGTSSGYDRPLAELVKLHRETFLNIDMQVIEELKECFFLVY